MLEVQFIAATWNEVSWYRAQIVPSPRWWVDSHNNIIPLGVMSKVPMELMDLLIVPPNDNEEEDSDSGMGAG